MTENERKRLSKRMSHALRHAPYQYGLTLGEGGWVSIWMEQLTSNSAKLTNGMRGM